MKYETFQVPEKNSKRTPLQLRCGKRFSNYDSKSDVEEKTDGEPVRNASLSPQGEA